MSLHRRVEARDRGLDRVARLTSLTLSGGLVLSGGFAALAAHAYAGHSRRSGPTGLARTPLGASAAPLGGSGLAPGATTPTTPLQAPNTLPQGGQSNSPQTDPQTVPQYYPPPQYYQPPPVVSGGS